MGGGLFLPHNQFNFPGLPVEHSPVIVIGDVLQSEAHLSEDKTGVYSEFTIRLVEVIKASSSLAASEMIVERLGGYVHYPDGRKLLYRVGLGGMPRVGARYLFFLKPTAELDYSILTAYEFGDKGVVALDPRPNLKSRTGIPPTSFERSWLRRWANPEDHKKASHARVIQTFYSSGSDPCIMALLHISSARE